MGPSLLSRPSFTSRKSSSSVLRLGRPGTLTLDPVDLPEDTSTFSSYVDAARLLVADFERCVDANPGSTAWNRSSAGGDRVKVRTAKGREMAESVKELVSEDDTWIGRLSAHSSAEGSWEDFLVIFPVYLMQQARFVVDLVVLRRLLSQNLLKDNEGHSTEWISELRGLEIVHPYDQPPPSEQLAYNSAAAVWISQLVLPTPLQDRTFLILVITVVPPDAQEFWNISIPIKHDDYYPPGKGEEAGRTRGRYVSVERVRRVESGKIEWIVLTAFTRPSSPPAPPPFFSLCPSPLAELSKADFPFLLS